MSRLPSAAQVLVDLVWPNEGSFHGGNSTTKVTHCPRKHGDVVREGCEKVQQTLAVPSVTLGLLAETSVFFGVGCQAGCGRYNSDAFWAAAPRLPTKLRQYSRGAKKVAGEKNLRQAFLGVDRFRTGC
jgi:hypothetical protein